MNLAELEALQSAAARRFIAANRDADPVGLALSQGGRGDIALRACLEQIDCHQRARLKLPALCRTEFLFEPLGLQQCSGEATAHYKATQLRGRRLVDLTGGLGIDSMYFARSFEQVVYCESNPLLRRLFTVNIRCLGLGNIAVGDVDGIDLLRGSPDDAYDWIYVDPSRRKGSRRIVDLCGCEPDVTRLERLLLTKAPNVCIKASPAFDISRAAEVFPALSEVQVVSVDGECKELLLFLSRSPAPAARLTPCIKAVLIDRGSGRPPAVFTKPSRNPAQPEVAVPEAAKQVAKFFFDPDAAIIKAGLVDEVARLFNLHRVGRGHCYLTSIQLPQSFPGRVFEVVGCLPWQRRAVAEYCQLHRISAAIINRRDFPLSPEKIRSMLGLAEGAEHYLFFTRGSSGQPLCVHARRISGSR